MWRLATLISSASSPPVAASLTRTPAKAASRRSALRRSKPSHFPVQSCHILTGLTRTSWSVRDLTSDASEAAAVQGAATARKAKAVPSG